MSVVFKDINAHIGGRQILHDVCGVVHKGTMMAILGPSGTGKSTLLNVLTGYVQEYTGQITIDDQPISKLLRRKISYVLQKDVFFAKLTLYETLKFAANLKQSSKLSSQTRFENFRKIISRLHLEKSLQTEMAHLSGGEKKLASIALELLSDPSIVIVDEPTSGIDSYCAHQMVDTLKNLAENSKHTVIITIHQPSSQMFQMFDNILLLANGHVAYLGPCNKVVEYFEKLDLYCDPEFNPADFILYQIKESKETREKLIQAAYDTRKTNHWPVELRNAESLCKLNNVVTDVWYDTAIFNSSFWTQILTLLQRNKTLYAKVSHAKYSIMERFIIGIICGVIFWQIPRNEKEIENRLGITFICILELFAQSSTYVTSTFVYFASNNVYTPHVFFGQLAMLLWTSYIAQAIASVSSALFTDRSLLVIFCRLPFFHLLISAGYFNMNFPNYMLWIKKSSPGPYLYHAMLQIDLDFGAKFGCLTGNLTKLEACHNETSARITADSILQSVEPLWFNLVVLLGFTALPFLFSYIILVYINNPSKKLWYFCKLCRKSDNQSVKSPEYQVEVECETYNHYQSSKSIGYDLVFRHVNASINNKQILHNISGEIKCTEMLAIMGSRGTGKTTLLNALTGRLKNYSGDITLNNKQINRALRRQIGYALQEDVFFSTLTLRETLWFCAQLRLPDSISKKKKVPTATLR